MTIANNTWTRSSDVLNQATFALESVAWLKMEMTPNNNPGYHFALSQIKERLEAIRNNAKAEMDAIDLKDLEWERHHKANIELYEDHAKTPF